MEKICFATLSIGDNYCSLARLLAIDLNKFAPGIPLFTLTSHPNYFSNSPNVIAQKHYSIFRSDYDKCFLIEEALKRYEVCICIDADMRVLDAWPINELWTPGINARSSTTILNHQISRSKQPDDAKCSKILELRKIEKLASKMGLDLEQDNVPWIHEFLFVVAPCKGLEKLFLDCFKQTALYCNLHNISAGCGVAMGLAASKAGFPVRRHAMQKVKFFDDRIEKIQISKGQANLEDSKHLFEELALLKYPNRPFSAKLFIKIKLRAKAIYTRLGAAIRACRDFQFYYR